MKCNQLIVLIAKTVMMIVFTILVLVCLIMSLNYTIKNLFWITVLGLAVLGFIAISAQCKSEEKTSQNYTENKIKISVSETK